MTPAVARRVSWLLLALWCPNSAAVNVSPIRHVSSDTPSTHRDETTAPATLAPVGTPVPLAPASAAPTDAPATAPPTPQDHTHAPTDAPVTSAPVTPSPPVTATPVTASPTLAPATNAPTASPTKAPTDGPPVTQAPAEPTPTDQPTYLPSVAPPAPKKHVSFLRILGKTIAWLILVLLSVVAFGAFMSHRYRIYYYAKTLWYTFWRLDCTVWLLSKLPFRSGSSTNDSFNTIIFDNDMNEGLLMRETFD